jgi:mRNA interferase RelE/StbE
LAYSVEVPARVAKALRKIPKKDAKAIIATLESFETNPRPPGAIRLTDRDEWRLRVGNYRILYLIEDKKLLVVVVRIQDRKDVYRKR